MALPKINEVPHYKTSIPSTGQKISFRPFLVKEQKILLIAMESQDSQQIVDAIANTLKSCIVDNINIESLATFDIEYLFTQIRSKSVGEISNVRIKCVECGEFTEVGVNLSDIKVDVNVSLKTVKLNDQYILKLRYPGYASMGQIDQMRESGNKQTLTEALHKLAVACLDELQTEDDLIKFDDESEADIADFIDNLTSTQFDQIMAFAVNIPTMKHELEFDCDHCSTHNNHTLQGLGDFF